MKRLEDRLQYLRGKERNVRNWGEAIAPSLPRHIQLGEMEWKENSGRVVTAGPVLKILSLVFNEFFLPFGSVLPAECCVISDMRCANLCFKTCKYFSYIFSLRIVSGALQISGKNKKLYLIPLIIHQLVL
jgi:hypothetical protein